MTDDEINELGRKALRRHKITVFVLHYTHKHGESIEVYGGLQSAREAAEQLIHDRVAESWDYQDRERLDLLKVFDERLARFNSVEQDVSYGDRIEILERTVGA